MLGKIKKFSLPEIEEKILAFWKGPPVLTGDLHLRNEDYAGSGYADITWHGIQAWKPDSSNHSRVLAFMLCGKHARGGTAGDSYIYTSMNMHWEAHTFELPTLPDGLHWYVFLNTSNSSPEDIWEPGFEPFLIDQHEFPMGPRSVAVLVGK